MSYIKELRFLIAEDNSFARAIARNVLQALGSRNIKYAKDGAQAVQIARTADIDVSLVDWNMPGVDGLEFTRFIRTAKDSPNTLMPIIMMTAYSEVPRVIEARDAGVTEYLIKPFSALQLVKRIQSAVESPRPFIKAKGFFGPDRRRSKKAGEAYEGTERRKTTPEPKEPAS